MLSPHIEYLKTKKVILGSSSPRRKYALEGLGLTFSVIPSSFPEDLDKSQFQHPKDYVIHTARSKTLDVATTLKAVRTCTELSQFKQKDQHFDLIIGADSIVVLGNTILEKPSSQDHAKTMLASLSGQKQQVYTAVCLVYHSPNGTAVVEFCESTEVVFSVLSSEMIDAYVATGSPMDKAGGYGIQEVAAGSFVESINGDYYNVTGFPVNRFCRELSQLISTGCL